MDEAELLLVVIGQHTVQLSLGILSNLHDNCNHRRKVSQRMLPIAGLSLSPLAWQQPLLCWE